MLTTPMLLSLRPPIDTCTKTGHLANDQCTQYYVSLIHRNICPGGCIALYDDVAVMSVSVYDRPTYI